MGTVHYLWQTEDCEKPKSYYLAKEETSQRAPSHLLDQRVLQGARKPQVSFCL